MEIKKPNDILIATLSNPGATPYDLLSSNITGENTSLLSKDDYKKSNYIQEAFKDENGKFNDIAFNQAYDLAQNSFYNLTNQEYLENLNKVEYSPFDITRPKLAKTFDVSAKMVREENPFEVRKGWAGIGSEIANPLSLRELAQREKVYDPTTDTWSDKTLNELGLLDKLFGDTYVYAQWDEDTSEIDPTTGNTLNHKKGDWKFNDNGKLYVEKLAGREIYGKQVVNSMDILTTDGSMINQFDFLDSDGREKSIPGTVFKLAAEIAPVFIPGVGTFYGGVRAAVGLASALPTFYKAIEGLLLGDEETSLTKSATALEGWMSKYTASSVSDEASDSMFGFEQMSSMVSDIFTQIYEQRAMASLSKMVMNGDKLMTAKTTELANKINTDLIRNAIAGKIKIDEIPELAKAAREKIPELKSVIAKQSQLSKALSLGYMALTSTSDIYGEALNSGYDRRTAGFAALASAAGQYTVMMNNGMGDWFLDETTGYSKEVNKAMMRKAVLPYLDEIAPVFNAYTKNPEVAKKALGISFKKIKNSISDIFTNPSVLGEAMWKNAVIEGVEEVTEQVVLDATKGIVDVMSYLGLTKKEGSFGGFSNVFSVKGAQTYLANLVGGVIGGGLFEFQNSKVEPWINPKMVSPKTVKSLTELVASGHKEDLISIINKERHKLGNNSITLLNQDGTFKQADDSALSQADVIADKAIDMVNLIDGILNSHNLIQSDEEIINKAVRDRITINMMKSSAPDKSSIGLEGLVLEDFKKKMVKIVQLEANIKALEANPENLAAAVKGNPNVIDSLKDELKIYVKDVNDILEGKSASKYFNQATFYLDKKLNSVFINTDRASYAKETYGVDYAKLPETGSGIELSQKRIDTEWEDYVNSKDLKKDLETAFKVYSNLETMLNPSIANFVESGYSEEYKKTITLVKDLKATIDLFNTSKSPEDKARILEHFTAINNELERLKLTLTPAWEVYHSDMFDQLNKQELIKKISYSDEDGKLVEKLEDLGEDSDRAKQIITNFFNKFPINPLNAESIIDKFNYQVTTQDNETIKKINTIKAKPELSEDDIQELEKLGNSLINIRIDSIENSVLGKGFILSANNQIDTIYKNLGITPEKLEEYTMLSQAKESFKKNQEELLADFKVSNWKELDQTGLKLYVSKLTDLGLINATLNKISAASTNADQVINESFLKINSEEQLTPEELEVIKGNLDHFFNVLNDVITNGQTIINNTEYERAKKEIDAIHTDLDKSLQSIKPEILKLNNHAFDLVLDGLDSGIADKELYNEGEVMFKEELTKILSTIFPDATSIKNAPGNEVLPLLNSIFSQIDTFNERLEAEYSAAELNPSNIDKDSTLEEALNDSKENIVSDPDWYKKEGLFMNKEFFDFIDNNFDKGTKLEDLEVKLRNSKSIYESYTNQIKKLEKFNEIGSKGANLKSNGILDFIRNFTLTLNSNPNNKTAKILDILKREENLLKSASSITNYTADGVTESDLNQAASNIDLIKSVITAMSTTTVDFNDPVGFIAARQNFAKKYNKEDEVLNLKTITSDMAELMTLELDRIKTKLLFLKDLSVYNSGKIMNEEEIKRARVDIILLETWKTWANKMNPSFVPPEKVKAILSSNSSDSKKVMQIENLIFETNVNNKEAALVNFLKEMSDVDSDVIIPIDKEVTTLSPWDLAIYYATVLSTKAEDVNIRNFKTINGNFTKCPFFSQELNARMLKGSTTNPDLFAKIVEMHSNSVKLDCSFLKVVTGGSGVGKTSAVFGLYLDNLRQTNDNTSIWLSTPDALQLKNLENGISQSIGLEKLTTSSFLKAELFEKLGLTELLDTINKELSTLADITKPKEYFTFDGGYPKMTDKFKSGDWLEGIADKLQNLPNILMIDEITHYSFVELYLLSEISKYSFKNKSLNYMTLVGAGDPGQMGSLLKINGKYFNFNINMVSAIFLPRLWASVRSANNQKRRNVDILNRVNIKANSIYDDVDDYKKADNELIVYLETTAELNLLSYYEDDKTINGDKIQKSLDQETVSRLKNIVKNDSSAVIGILTENGELPEEWNTLLSNVGLITPTGEMPNIKLFSPENVQGSETDYFIFDVKLTTIYDKLRDNLKSFYTYTSRSKKGSIIIDSENIVNNKYKLVNGKKDATTNIFDPLTSTVIKLAKDRRSKDLLELIEENATPSEYDNFKWSSNTEASVDLGGSRFIMELKDDKIFPEGDNLEVEKKKDREISDAFKVMFHGFYNNPNAIINKDGSVTVNPSNGPFDLNVPNPIDKEESNKVINDWLKLKSALLFDKPKTIKSTDYINFLRRAFVGLSSDSSEMLDVSYVITVKRYNDTINSAYAKQGFDSSKTLKNEDLFINLTAKIWFNGRFHYVTLATLGVKDEILNKAKDWEYSDDTINNRFKYLEEQLDKSPSKTLELKIADPNKINFSTKTRLEKIKKENTEVRIEYNLSELSEKFPNMNVSEIRFFPWKRDLFIKLINKYTFGKKREDVLSPEKFTKYYESLRNQAYVVVSYKNDLNGSDTSNETQAVLVPIGSHKRSLKKLTSEVEELLDLRKIEILRKTGVSDELNAKTETLLNRSDILNVLIEWATTKHEDGTLLDLLDKEITFSISDQVTGTKTSVFKIFSQFIDKDEVDDAKKSKKQLSVESLKNIISKVKSEVSKNPTSKSDLVKFKAKVKDNLVSEIKGINNWHWTFFNIFAYKKLIQQANDKEFSKLILKGIFTEDSLEAFNNSEGATEMSGILKTLVESLTDMKFYYSIPIKSKDGEIIANPSINGLGGFKKEMFADKFFINVAPEPARLLMDADMFFEAEIINDVAQPVVESSSVVGKGIKPGTVPESIDGEVTANNDVYTNLIDKLEKNELVPKVFIPLINKASKEVLQELSELNLSEVYNESGNRIKIEKILQTLGINSINARSVKGAMKLNDQNEFDEKVKLENQSKVKDMIKNINELLKLCNK